MYALVLFTKGAQPETPETNGEHEAFIDGLIGEHRVLLGGSFALPAGPFVAAYLLRYDSLEDAARIASGDPYFRDNVYRPEIVPWELVGVDPEAIEPEMKV